MTPYLEREAARVAREIGGPAYIVTDQDGLFRVRGIPRAGDTILFHAITPTPESGK